MIRAEIEDKSRKMVANLLDIEESSIDDKSNFVNDLNADSLDAVELIMTTEDEFEICITDKEAENVISFKSLINLIERKMNG